MLMVIVQVLANLRETLQSSERGTDHQPIGNTITKKMLNNKEENVLRCSVDTPRVRGDFSGTGVSHLRTVHSIPLDLTFHVNGETRTAFWPPCLTKIVLKILTVWIISYALLYLTKHKYWVLN